MVGRFVEEQQVGLGGQQSRQSGARLLPAGEFGEGRVERNVAQPEPVQQGVRFVDRRIPTGPVEVVGGPFMRPRHRSGSASGRCSVRARHPVALGGDQTAGWAVEQVGQGAVGVIGKSLPQVTEPAPGRDDNRAAVWASSPEMMRSRVDLPAPFGPTRPTRSPGFTIRLMSSRIRGRRNVWRHG